MIEIWEPPQFQESTLPMKRPFSELSGSSGPGVSPGDSEQLLQFTQSDFRNATSNSGNGISRLEQNENHILAPPLCRNVSGTFAVLILEDFAGEFPGG